jgi:hypothetical protein
MWNRRTNADALRDALESALIDFLDDETDALPGPPALHGATHALSS